jgi:uncharacterized protein (TIGR02118 family)
MFKVTAILSQPDHKEEFDHHYFNIHVPLIKNLPNVKDVTVSHTFDSQLLGRPVYLLATFAFESKLDLDAAFSCEAGQKLYEDVPNLVRFLGADPLIIFSETIETPAAIKQFIGD